MKLFKDKTILITGGAGSLGRVLCEKLHRSGAKIIAFSRDEGKHFLLKESIPDIETSIGDIRDFEKINQTCAFHKPDYIIHAAALKRIDDMEMSPDECVKTNIEGSQNVARSALYNNVKKCILISTDKACEPVNVYGSSKFIAERIFTNFDFHNNNSDTIFSSVRYGNVIASRGSFIPLFMDKIKDKKNIDVTSEQMTRFLFTLKDASNAVLNALTHSTGGEVFVPQINSYTLPSCISALEKILGEKAKTRISGLRPGEKLHEDMLSITELPFTYKVPDVDLLQVRPQYTKKTYQDFDKYTGPHFNSELWIQNEIEPLISLIKTGLL